MVTLELYIDLGEFLSDKKYKKQMLKEIVACLCALFNGSGGKIKFNFNEVQKNAAKRIDSFIRIVEQSCTKIIGTQMTVLNLDAKMVRNNIVCTVKKSESFVTTHYNLYLPSTTEVLTVPPTEIIKDNILTRQHVDQPVELGSHHKSFVRHTVCNLTEGKKVQLKLLEASAKNGTKLVHRMMNNKLIVYVSAFANHNGGHIYYGITDDGVVAGEEIPNEDTSEIINKVEKAIKKMIWPEHIGQPKRGEDWDIFFEPVVDENSMPIPSTFVIVIYIAPCLGGVFTEEPECYGLVKGKVEKLPLATWRERTLQLDTGIDEIQARHAIYDPRYRGSRRERAGYQDRMEQGEKGEHLDRRTDLEPSKNPRHTEPQQGGNLGHFDMSAIVNGTALGIPSQEIGNDPLKKTSEPKSQPEEVRTLAFTGLFRY
jgi:hypothetical protein